MDTQAQPSGNESPHHVAFWAASASVALSVFGSCWAVVVFSRTGSSAMSAWMAFPLVVSVAGTLFSLKAWSGPLWICAGALCGFVVLAMWSIGGFYYPAALAMLAAAVVHTVQASRNGTWRVTAGLLWMVAGVSGLGTFFRVLAWWQTSVTDYDWSSATGFGHVHEAHSVSVAPVEVWASWLFVAVCAVLIIGHWVAHDQQHQD